MAEIYLAHHEVDSRDKLVVKRIRQDRANDPAHVELFLNEARIATHFKHPNLVPVRELIEDHGQLAMAMDFVDGYSVKELLHRCRQYARTVPFEIAAYVIAEAAEGLHYAHELRDESGRHLKIVHRDVSPANIIVTRSGGVRLLDFGVAACDLPMHDEPGAVRGKFSYLAPEAVLNQPVDRRADVFGLGVVFYELITLHPCFTHEDPIDTLDAIIHGRFRPAREWRESMPAELEILLGRMLSRRADDRLATAADVSILLWQYLVENEPVMADDIQSFFGELFYDLPEVEHSPHERPTIELDSHWMRDFANAVEGDDIVDEDTLIEITEADLLLSSPEPSTIHVDDVLAVLNLPLRERPPTLWEPEPIAEEWSVTTSQELIVPKPMPIDNEEVWWVHESGVTRRPNLHN